MMFLCQVGRRSKCIPRHVMTLARGNWQLLIVNGGHNPLRIENVMCMDFDLLA